MSTLRTPHCYRWRMGMTVDQLLAETRRRLSAAGVDTPALDARILVRQGASFTDGDLIARGSAPLPDEVMDLIEKMVARRLAGEPVSRILGEREFWGMSFKVTPDTLDPRPDTETLVSAALAKARAMGRDPLRILDLGTGTGCILISLLVELPTATGVAIDLNPGAVEIARANAVLHGVQSRLDVRPGSWFTPLRADERFDLIVTNPPYIPAGEIESLSMEVRGFDPALALDGGRDGLDAYKMILDNANKHLVCGGAVFLEIGAGQEKDLARLGHDSMMNHVASYRDLSGIIRVIEMACGEN